MHPAPAFKSVCSNCGKVRPITLSATRNQSPATSLLATTRCYLTRPSLHLPGPQQIGETRICHPSMMSLNHADPAPTLTVHIAALNGQANVEVLPDSGADISAAGIDFLAHFNEHILNLLPSDVTVDGLVASMLSSALGAALWMTASTSTGLFQEPSFPGGPLSESWHPPYLNIQSPSKRNQNPPRHLLSNLSIRLTHKVLVILNQRPKKKL